MKFIKNYLKYIPYLIIFFLVFLLIKTVSIKNNLKELYPHLIKGEKVGYFDLMDKNSHRTEIEILKENNISLIFIFKLPCSTCSGNILYWNRIARILNGKVKIYGIVPGIPSQMFDLLNEAKLNFKIYIPNDFNKFIKKNKVKTNLSYTIVCLKGKIILNIPGNLTGDDYLEIVRVVKLLL